MLPSDMIEDQPVHMEHIRAIEATMDEMKSQHEATHQLLQDVLAQLGPTQAHNMQDPLLTHPACRSPTPSIYWILQTASIVMCDTWCDSDVMRRQKLSFCRRKL